MRRSLPARRFGGAEGAWRRETKRWIRRVRPTSPATLSRRGPPPQSSRSGASAVQVRRRNRGRPLAVTLEERVEPLGDRLTVSSRLGPPPSRSERYESLTTSQGVPERLLPTTRPDLHEILRDSVRRIICWLCECKLESRDIGRLSGFTHKETTGSETDVLRSYGRSERTDLKRLLRAPKPVLVLVILFLLNERPAVATLGPSTGVRFHGGQSGDTSMATNTTNRTGGPRG